MESHVATLAISVVPVFAIFLDGNEWQNSFLSFKGLFIFYFSPLLLIGINIASIFRGKIKTALLLDVIVCVLFFFLSVLLSWSLESESFDGQRGMGVIFYKIILNVVFLGFVIFRYCPTVGIWKKI